MTEAYKEPAGFGALFDLSFTRFITISVVRIIYILGMVLIGLGYLIMMVAAFSQNAAAGLGVLIFGPIVAAIYLLMLRVWLELIVVIFRIGENTSAMVQAMGATPPTGGFPVMPPAGTHSA